MEPVQSVISTEDTAPQCQEKVSVPEENKPNSRLLENGWHGYDFMQNGNPRPSVVREYPEGIIPLHCRRTDATGEYLASEREEQTQALPDTSRDNVKHNQEEENISPPAEGEGINLIVELGEHEKGKPALKASTENKPDKSSNHTLKKMKAGQRESKNFENTPPKSSKLGEKKTISAESKISKQEADTKQVNEKTSAQKDSPKALPKAGKSTEMKRPAAVVPQQIAEVRSGKKEATVISKPQKVTTKNSNVVSTVGREIKKPETHRQTDASEAKKKQGENTLEKDIEQPRKEKMAESNIEVLSIKRKSGGQDMSHSLTGQSDESKLQEKDASVPPIQATKESELLSTEGETEAMDLDKQETTEKGLEQHEQERVVDPNTKNQPVKKRSGTDDVPDSVPPQAKKMELKKGVGHETSGQEVKVSPSKASGTTKERAKPDIVKVTGKIETANGKPGSTVNKKRPLEGPNSGEKSKKVPKTKPSKEEQTPSTAKEKQSELETKGGTPKRSTKKPSNSSEPSKKIRRSGGKPAKPTNVIGDVSNARNLILESLRLYDSVRRKCLQDEEKNGKQGRSSRADLQAVSSLKDQNIMRGPEKAYGALPGVLVGDIYLFRTELSFVRVHGPIQGGIEYLTAKDSEFNVPVAISIISNVGQDGEDDGDELVYTGQGGRSADNKQVADQKLERGNLALDGSRKFNVPVRVIRGMKDMNSPTNKIYIYDGLYDVQETYTEKGSGGFDEFKFKLQRRADQPELGSNALKLAADLKSQSPSSRKDVVIADISKGKESQVISVENAIDEDKGPAEFQYATKLIYPKDLGELEVSGCKCSGGCPTSGDCSCYTQNGGEFAYLNGGYLVREKDFVFECGSSCSCSSSCRNRGLGTGLRFRFDIFKTADKGWGVRSLELIPAGSFVCEYVGKVVTEKKTAKESSDRKYMLSTNWLPETTQRWGEISNLFPDRPSSSVRPDAGKPDLIIDASNVGNIARFINHSCSPNLLVQKVLSGHQDVRYPQFKLFAIDNIPPLKELTFDYGCPPPDEEPGAEQIVCLCGSFDCRGRLYI